MQSGRRSLAVFFLAGSVSTLGTEMAAVALPWFVLVTSRSPGRTGLVMVAESAGIAVCGIPSGHLAAVLGPKVTLIVSDLVRAVLVALIPVLFWTHLLALGWLLAIGFAVGAFFAAYSSSQWLGMVRLTGPDEDRLTRVGGVFGAADEAASFAGPALGGVLVAALGPAPVLLIDAVSFLLPGLVVAFVMPATPARPGDSGEQAVMAGVRWLLGDRRLARRVLGVALQNLGWSAMMVTLPVMALTRFHGGARMAGWFVAAYGGGSVIGGLALTRVKAPGDRMAVAAICGFAVSTWLLWVAPWPWAVAVAVGCGGVCFGVFFARFFSTLTLRAPESIRAKVMAAVNTLLSATGPVGFVGAGLLLQHTHSAATGLAAIAAVCTLGAILVATTAETATARTERLVR